MPVHYVPVWIDGQELFRKVDDDQAKVTFTLSATLARNEVNVTKCLGSIDDLRRYLSRPQFEGGGRGTRGYAVHAALRSLVKEMIQEYELVVGIRTNREEEDDDD